MSDDKPVKSAYELAIERLEKKDKEQGIVPRALTDEQRATISEIRSFYDAKLAELELLHQSKMRSVLDPGERAVRDQEYRRDRERLTGERDAKIEKARRSGS